ncbi:MAG: Ig-like domain-containing protein [Butyrivibrio sp.]|nr:Ig-like domain-containing protein [Butyrivibrio sp.]MBR1643532.1 Ig-like domain-containing protein [Butyrivibrio sp.]
MRRFLKCLLSVVLVMFCLFSACAESSSVVSQVISEVKVKSVQINEKNVSVAVGGSEEAARAQLTVTIAPEDATFKTGVWSSSNENVVTVNSDGVITGISPGSANIVFTSSDPDSKKKAQVAVKVVQAVTAINLSENEVVQANKTLKLKTEIVPKNATKKGLVWSSADKSIATVNSEGIVKGISKGETVITVEAADGYGAIAYCNVKVVQPVKKISFESKSLLMPPEQQLQVKPIIEPEDATIKDLVWSSSDDKVASVSSDGVITTLKKGKCTIVATSTDGSKVKGSISLQVKNFDAVLTKRGVNHVDFKTNDEDLHSSLTGPFGTFEARYKATVTIANGCVEKTGNNNELLPVKVGSDTVTVVESDNGKKKKHVYNVFVAESAFAAPVIEDLGYGRGVVISEGIDGIFNDHYYKVYYDRLTWEEARAKCEADGGHLLIVNTAEEQQFAEALNIQRKALWIGLIRNTETDIWSWYTDDPFDYINWKAGEPSNGAETKGCLWPDAWNDLREDSTREIEGYVCEWDVVPSSVQYEE